MWFRYKFFPYHFKLPCYYYCTPFIIFTSSRISHDVLITHSSKLYFTVTHFCCFVVSEIENHSNKSLKTSKYRIQIYGLLLIIYVLLAAEIYISNNKPNEFY